MPLDSLTLRSPDGITQAEFVPGANMLCRSFTHHGAEQLEQRRGLDAYLNQGKTMGIPLLYPWANRLSGFEYSAAGKHVVLPQGDGRIPRDPNGLPNHGVLPALMRFEVERAEAARVIARLPWRSQELLELFPFRHEVIVEASIGTAQLDVMTTVVAAEDSVPVSFEYHPYLRLLGSPRESWNVTIPARRHLQLDDGGIPTGRREPFTTRSFGLEDRSLDDAFDDLEGPHVFSAVAGDKTVSVEFEAGYPVAQVYATPGGDFICFEPMTACANALRSGDGLNILGPGESYRARFRIALPPTALPASPQAP